MSRRSGRWGTGRASCPSVRSGRSPATGARSAAPHASPWSTSPGSSARRSRSGEALRIGQLYLHAELDRRPDDRGHGGDGRDRDAPGAPRRRVGGTTRRRVRDDHLPRSGRPRPRRPGAPTVGHAFAAVTLGQGVPAGIGQRLAGADRRSSRDPADPSSARTAWTDCTCAWPMSGAWPGPWRPGPKAFGHDLLPGPGPARAHRGDGALRDAVAHRLRGRRRARTLLVPRGARPPARPRGDRYRAVPAAGPRGAAARPGRRRRRARSTTLHRGPGRDRHRRDRCRRGRPRSGLAGRRRRPVAAPGRATRAPAGRDRRSDARDQGDGPGRGGVGDRRCALPATTNLDRGRR